MSIDIVRSSNPFTPSFVARKTLSSSSSSSSSSRSDSSESYTLSRPGLMCCAAAASDDGVGARMNIGVEASSSSSSSSDSACGGGSCEKNSSSVCSKLNLILSFSSAIMLCVVGFMAVSFTFCCCCSCCSRAKSSWSSMRPVLKRRCASTSKPQTSCCSRIVVSVSIAAWLMFKHSFPSSSSPSEVGSASNATKRLRRGEDLMPSLLLSSPHASKCVTAACTLVRTL